MEIQSVSTTLVTQKLKETKAFYLSHFDARLAFDCGWYVVLRLGASPSGPEICLMEPQEGMVPFTGGIFLNILVRDADAMYERLHDQAGLPVIMPLEDHPWGDRGFGLLDPSGALVYCYHPIPPAAEFQQYILD